MQVNSRFFLKDMNKATTIDEQIKILQGRGMIITDIPKAKEVLQDIGYYRLGVYWFPFEKTFPLKDDKRHHSFKESTTFDDIVKLYYFDQDLRNILNPYLFRIEVDFRTHIIYLLSNHYKKDPFWFSDSRIINHKWIDNLCIVYKNIKRNNDIIKRHHKKYRNDIYAPAWKTLEFMTFGDIIMLYQNLKNDNIKTEIAKYYKVKRIRIFESYMNTIRVIRNQCAHGRNLYDYNLSRAILQGPLNEIEGKRSHDVCGAIYVILFILNTISQNRAIELKNKIIELLEKNKTLSKHIGALYELNNI